MTLSSALAYVVLTAVVATTFLCAGLAMTHATIHRLAQTYIAAAYQRAEASLQETIADDLRAGALPSPLPSFTPLPAQCVDAAQPCKYQSSVTISLGQTSGAANEETNAYISEGRLTARITVTITAAADGAVLATRGADLILRTLRTPPYVLVAGTRDASFDDVVSSHAAGDDGGAAPATPNPCSSSWAAADDTVVSVAYRNQVTNACTDGSAWRTQPGPPSGRSSGWTP